MRLRTLFSLVFGAGLLLVGCSRKGNNPILATPDPSVTGIDVSIIGDPNTTDLKNVKVTLSVTTNTLAPLTGLVLGNIVIQEGVSLEFEPIAIGIPISLVESSSVPGDYELIFQPRSVKGYEPGFQYAWITVAYGNLTSRTHFEFPTHH